MNSQPLSDFTRRDDVQRMVHSYPIMKFPDNIDTEYQPKTLEELTKQLSRITMDLQDLSNRIYKKDCPEFISENDDRDFSDLTMFLTQKLYYLYRKQKTKDEGPEAK